MTGSAHGLVDQYDLLLLDLDGVVYVGEHPVSGAVSALAEARRRSIPICFVTNNASRSARAVAELLTRIGVVASEQDVLTSAQAAAELLARRLPAGSPVLVVGSPALIAEVALAGLVPVARADDRPVAVIQGYGPDLGWRQLAEAAVALNEGAFWVATNTDRTLPTERGPLPGNGALVAALTVATGRQPDVVVGKPAPELFLAAVKRFDARRPLVVGDRLDTDIEAANRAEFDGVLVLTGVADAADVLSAPSQSRPRYLAADLTDLYSAYPLATVTDDVVRCRGWKVSPSSTGCELSGEGTPIDALRALAEWSRSGSCDGVTPTTAAAEQALRELGLLRTQVG